jgi:hypothetical protein
MVDSSRGAQHSINVPARGLSNDGCRGEEPQRITLLAPL